jgi:hypothetical protein
MNCDQVFDVLTRGPFPTGHASDLAVESHLSDCVDCARLAEALRPAIELFEEAVTEEESRTLPGYWGALAELPGDVKLLPVEEPRAARRERIRLAADRLTGPLTVSLAWRMAAAVLLGFLAMTIVRELKWPERQPAAIPRVASRSAATSVLQPRLTAVGMQHIALLGPSKNCFSDSLPVIKCEAGEGSPLASSEAGLNCCNACHAYSTDPAKISHLATSTALRACQECHAN